MANVHGVGDLPRDNNRGAANPRGNLNMPGANMAARIPFFASNQEPVNPRTQGFPSTIKSILCPFFKPVSFIFLICIIDVAFYIATLIWSSYHGGLDNSGDIFLGPSTQTLIDFGAKVCKFIRK